jgi:glycogen synthase
MGNAAADHAAPWCERNDHEDHDGWRFHRTPPARPGLARFAGGTYGAEMAATARRIEQLARQFAPDVLHAHSPVLNVLPALAIGRRLGIPVVYEMRASWEDAAVDHGTTREGSLRYRASRALETFALKRAAAVTTICEGLRNDIVARGVNPQRVTVIPNAVDVEAFRSAGTPDSTLRAALGLHGEVAGLPDRSTATKGWISRSMRCICCAIDARGCGCCCSAAVRRNRH